MEDLISTGGSCIDVVNALREVGAEVLGVASIFTYDLKKGLDKLADANVINHSASNFHTLIHCAAESGYIEHKDIEKCLAFQKDPNNSDWMSL